jgi:inosine/xanthosine triphosphatase
MIINVGSKNKQKVEAVSELLEDYPDFCQAQVISKDVSSGVSHQPKSLEETVEGAIKRARNSFEKCDYSIGLESGLMKVPQTKTGYMDTTVCAIYDGKNFHLGMSSCFEYPVKVTKYVFDNDAELSDAFRDLGLTKKQKIGEEEGIIGILTKGKLVRKDYTKEAIRTALVHLENKQLYEI